MATQLTPIEVFCSYAHKDEDWRCKLEKHLNVLQQQGLISLWHDRLITPGTNWAKAIDHHLEHASIILLLVSADFFASDYCYGIEMKRALERQEASEAVVIPILVRPTEWQRAPFAHLQALPSEALPLTSWSNEEQALTDVVAGIRRVIEEMPLLAASAPRAALPAVWNVPYPRNPFFLGREQELTQIHQQLHRGLATALSQPQAISGLGGIGKTQLALEYAYQYHQDYQMILWAQAESTEALVSSYIALAALLRLPEREAKEQDITVQAVKTWLQTHRDWLLILDNADELALVPDFLPHTFGGHLLLTTRAVAMGRLAYRLEIDTLLPEQGALFLLRRSGHIAPDATLEQASPLERKLAVQISQDFGGLPLALDQAGAYLEETGMNLAGYTQLYQHHRTTLLQERRGLVADHPAPVATTWSLSFERVKEKNLAAVHLLRMAAFLAPDAIPEELFTDSASFLDPMFAPVAADPLHFNHALEVLRAYSLIRRNPTSKTLSLHRLVQAVLQDTLEEEEQRRWAEQVMLMINAAFPSAEYTMWQQCERLLPQAMTVTQWIGKYQFRHEEAAWLLYKTASYLHARTRYTEAEPLFQQALRIREQLFGQEHSDVAASLNGLASLYFDQNKYAEAEPLFQRALHIREQLFGQEHPDVAASLNKLASLYFHQGKYQEAEPLFQRALRILEQVLGSEHLFLAHPLNNLGSLYFEQGKYQEAEPLFQRALHIWEQALNSDHPDIARALNYLANLYFMQGKYQEAEPLFQRALHIWEQALGPEHSYVAHSLIGLANLYLEHKEYHKAEPLFQRALHIWEQMLGSENLLIAYPLNNLAFLYFDQKEYHKAELLYQQALRIWERALGPEHPDVAYPLNGLATISRDQGKYTEAESLFQRALSIRKQALGVQHSETAETMHDFALLRDVQGERNEAKTWYTHALEVREKTIGKHHSKTRETRKRLIVLLRAMGEHEEAIQLETVQVEQEDK